MAEAQVKGLLPDMPQAEWRLGLLSLHATFKSLGQSSVDPHLRIYFSYTLS